MFSSRTNWLRQQNRLTELLDARRTSGKPVYDLTNSNPTECGIVYPEKEILSALSNPNVLKYQPDPHGLLTARESVAQYYHEKNVVVNPSDIFLTSSTSEAYSLIFKLMCNPGEHVLVPRPSYPLFDYLAQINDVQLQHYELFYDHGWHIDIDSIRSVISPSTKAIILVHPHNPTGMFLKKSEYNAIKEIAGQYNIALIVDEVFIDYPFEQNENRITSTADESDVLTFTMNGISKMAGLPQMKLGWIIVSGELRAKSEAGERLEILCDTFLSVNTPVQVAMTELLKSSASVRAAILQRVKSNYNYLHQALKTTSFSPLFTEGGWYGIIKTPRTKNDDEWALSLLENYGVYVFPGYFFDFQESTYLVTSLLVEETIFCNGLTLLAES